MKYLRFWAILLYCYWIIYIVLPLRALWKTIKTGQDKFGDN